MFRAAKDFEDELGWLKRRSADSHNIGYTNPRAVYGIADTQYCDQANLINATPSTRQLSALQNVTARAETEQERALRETMAAINAEQQRVEAKRCYGWWFGLRVWLFMWLLKCHANKGG